MKIPSFLHNSTTSQSRAILEVRAIYGWKGYGQYLAILEAITANIIGRVSWPQLRELFEDDIDSDFLWCLIENGLLEWVEDEDTETVFYRSPILEAQARDVKLARHLNLLIGGIKAGRPGIPKGVRSQVLAAGRCVYCGATKELQVDHIHPYSRGGAHSIENFQPLCRLCNSAKRDKTEQEYFALIGRTNG